MFSFVRRKKTTYSIEVDVLLFNVLITTNTIKLSPTKCTVLNQKWRGTCKENVASSSAGAVSVIDITDVTSGYVASFDTAHTAGTGSAACPWRIRAKSGQTIQLNAFSSIIAQTRPGDDGGLGGSGGASAAYDDVCYDVALIREHQATTRGGMSILPVAEQRITACSSDAQEDERTVFTSTSHVVDIVFTARNEPSRGPHFILGFTGKRHVSYPVYPWHAL